MPVYGQCVPLSQLVFWSIEHFNHITSRLHIAWLVTGISILRDLDDISDTKMTTATSIFLFLRLVQMICHVAVDVVSSLVAGIFGDVVAGMLGDVMAGIFGDKWLT